MVDLERTLSDAQTIAVVGASDNPNRVSYAIIRYLTSVGYAVIPVNPTYDKVQGLACYPSLSAVPTDTHIDIVDIFRAPEHTASVVHDVIERVELTATTPVIWTQLGVSSIEAEEHARLAGLGYVTNRCIMVEHRRLKIAAK